MEGKASVFSTESFRLRVRGKQPFFITRGKIIPGTVELRYSSLKDRGFPASV